MTEIEKLAFLIDTLESGSQKRFADKIGVIPPTISKIMAGKMTLKTRYNTILSAYPQVNRSWLETGEGYPGDLSVDLVRQHYLDIIKEKDRIISVLTYEIEMQQKIIEKTME